MEGKRNPRSEEDVLRDYENKKKKQEELGSLGAPAIPVKSRSTNYGSLSQFQKEEAKKVPAVINPMPIVGSRRRRRLTRKTRRGGKRKYYK